MKIDNSVHLLVVLHSLDLTNSMWTMSMNIEKTCLYSINPGMNLHDLFQLLSKYGVSFVLGVKLALWGMSLEV